MAGRGRLALPLLHGALVFSQGLLFHRNDLRDAVVIDGDLEVDGDGAVDPFAAARVFDVVIVFEAGGVIAVRRFFAETDVAADGGAARRPTSVIRFYVLLDRVGGFSAFFKKVDVRRVERHREIDVVRLVARDEVVDEVVDPNLPGAIVPRPGRFLVRFGWAW